MIFLEQLPVCRCYTVIIPYACRGVVMWLVTYFQYPHYKCIVTQNEQWKWDHVIKSRQPRGGPDAANGSCTTVLLFTLWPGVTWSNLQKNLKFWAFVKSGSDGGTCRSILTLPYLTLWGKSCYRLVLRPPVGPVHVSELIFRLLEPLTSF